MASTLNIALPSILSGIPNPTVFCGIDSATDWENLWKESVGFKVWLRKLHTKRGGRYGRI